MNPFSMTIICLFQVIDHPKKKKKKKKKKKGEEKELTKEESELALLMEVRNNMSLSCHWFM